MDFRIPGQEHFVVEHNSWEDGGGTWFGQEYVDILINRYQSRWHSCLEWCSGPGFIGFALLAHRLCERLVLHDCHGDLADNIQKTAQRNSVQDQVRFYVGDSIQCLPQQKFDLVVANPPHYLVCPGDDNYQRLAVDKDWQAHRNFFQSISTYLAQDGIILLQENQAGSLNGVTEFWQMIHNNNLRISAYWSSPRFWDTKGPTQIYYIEIKHAKSFTRNN